MFANLRRSVGLLYVRWHFRKEHDIQQPLTDFLRRATSILIVLPRGYEEAQVAGNTLKKLFNVVKNRHLTIVTTGVRATALSDASRSEVIRLEEIDINKFFLPRQPVLQRILARSYDVAIDLNLDFVLDAAYICKASRAPVRVGLMRRRGELFFNIQLNLDCSGSPQVVYEKFVQCLGMF